MIKIQCDRCKEEQTLSATVRNPPGGAMLGSTIDRPELLFHYPQEWEKVSKKDVCDKCMSKFRAYFMKQKDQKEDKE
jgi:hypothetical protein